MSPKQFNDIYRGKKVFVTGHTGFKGSWLALWLTQLGAEVIGYSIDIPTEPSHFELLELDLHDIRADILDKKKLTTTIKTYKPDIIFHLAAQPIVRDSYLNPVRTFETNIMGTVNVLEACRQSKDVKAIVNVTSDKCYQNNEQERGYNEDDPMGGRDPYSASKGATEIVSQSYGQSFFHPDDYQKQHHTLLANVRAGNVIGGGDWAQDRLIPDIIRATSQNKTTIVRNPASTRPWQHVLEPLTGYMQVGWKLLEGKKEFANNWNFGPDEDATLTVKEVIEHAKKSWEAITYTLDQDSDHPHEARLLTLDSTKARTQLRWKNVWKNEPTFDRTITWYKKYYQTGAVNSRQDMEHYIADAQTTGADWITS